MNKLTDTKHPDYNRSGEIVTAIRSAIKVLVKADFSSQHKTKNWKRLTDTFNHDDFILRPTSPHMRLSSLTDTFNRDDFMQKLASTIKKLIARSDFECRTKQQCII